MPGGFRVGIAVVLAMAVAGCGVGIGTSSTQAQHNPALDAVATAASGSVAKVLGTRCDAAPITGSAFVIGRHQLLTASHAVAGARQVAIALPGAPPMLAEVAGLDPSTDTALLRTASELPAAALNLRDETLAAGSSLVLLGYPLGGDGLSTVQALASSTTDEVVVNGFDMTRLLTLDVELAIGNSGGPVLDDAGAVAGMIVARMGGRAWRDRSGQVTVAIAAPVLSERLAGWAEVTPLVATPCSGESDAAASPLRADDRASAGEPGFVVWLFAAGVNAGQYPSSWQLLTPAARLAQGSFEQWQATLAGLSWKNLQLTSAAIDRDRARVSGSIEQLTGSGCALQEFTYQLRRVDGLWLIDEITGQPGGRC